MPTATAELMTAEEFFVWANRPENAEKRYELENGEVVEMPSPGEAHTLVCWFVITVLTKYIARRGNGQLLTNDCGLIVRRGPDTVRGPDVMLSLESLTLENANKSHSDRVPALVVEVRSPSDRDTRILKRVAQYHKRGVPLVWVVDPEDRIVTSYRPNEFPKLMDESDTLTGNGVLPDFSCPVSELFRLPADTKTPASQP